MYSYLQTDSLDYLSIDELQIYMSLFADDTVLFSYTKPGLQILLNKLHTYCNDSLVAPILNYSSEVWVFTMLNDVENIHLKLLKQVLGVH